MLRQALSLRAVKTVHTLAWAFFAGCILALPVAAWQGDFRVALVLIGVVLVEVAVLVVNGMRCPLTHVAARFTDDRRDNFDIYLPLWLARYNKAIFGWLFVAGLVVTLARWMGWL
jgi:polyferredoxin